MKSILNKFLGKPTVLLSRGLSTLSEYKPYLGASHKEMLAKESSRAPFRGKTTRQIRQEQAALKYARVNDLSIVKGGRGWINVLLNIVTALGQSLSKPWVRVLRAYARCLYILVKSQGARKVTVQGFRVELGKPRSTVYRTEYRWSLKFSVKYLKACQVLLMQSIGGQRIPAAQDLGVAVSRTKSGIPRIIPRLHRQRIREGKRIYIRFWLSILGVYRVLSFVGELKLDTIIKGSGLPSTLDPSEVRAFIPIFFRRLADLCSGRLARALRHAGGSLPLLGGGGFTLFRKSGPANESLMGYLSSSFFGLYEASRSWLRAPMELLSSLHVISEATMPSRQIIAFIRQLGAWGTYGRKADGSQEGPTGSNRVHPLGKLGQKEEAAGKVRVFAMVDWFTQMALKPIHEFIQTILVRIPQDGTFDQVTPGARLGRSLNKQTGLWVASYDLSAATDCLPVWIQQCLLEYLFGPSIAKAWATLLVGRPYVITVDNKVRSLYYGVGQPMGALSSWVMLALTHHFICQLAYYRTSKIARWYPYYYVLGDDNVQARQTVAVEYLRIMDQLGVKIGLAKSLVSPKGVFEFAKKVYRRGTNLTPISVKEIIVGLQRSAVLLEIARKNRLTIMQMITMMGYRHNVKGRLYGKFDKLPSRVREILVEALSPTGPWPLPFGEWIIATSITGRASPSSSDANKLEGLKLSLFNDVFKLHSKIRAFLQAKDYPNFPSQATLACDPDAFVKYRQALRAYMADSPFLNHIHFMPEVLIWSTIYQPLVKAQRISLIKLSHACKDLYQKEILNRWFFIASISDLEELYGTYLALRHEYLLLREEVTLQHREEHEDIPSSKFAIWKRYAAMRPRSALRTGRDLNRVLRDTRWTRRFQESQTPDAMIRRGQKVTPSRG